MQKQSILGSVTGETGVAARGTETDSSPLARWEWRLLEEATRIGEDCGSSSGELDRGCGPVFATHAASAPKVLVYEAELGARLTAVVPGDDDPDEYGTVSSWLYFQ